MNTRAKALLAAAAVICLIPAAAFAAIVDFSQDFETLDPANSTALGDDGWIVYGNVFEAGTGNFLYGYGPEPAPNNPAAPAFSNIVVGEGGLDQGLNQLSIFSDYENAGAHVAGDLVNANFFMEFPIDASDVGKDCTFAFSAKLGNLAPPSTALAFIKTLDPANGYAETNFVFENMSLITTEWGDWALELAIDASLEGQIIQFGFACDATSYNPSSIIYDNIVMSTVGGGPSGMDSYTQDFENLNAASLTALGDDSWIVYGNVFSGTTGDFLYGYGPNPAPNNPAAPAFSTIAVGEGGIEQGAQQLSVFSDYENAAAQVAGDLVEANVFQEQVIGLADVGKTWVFQFDAKMPSVGGVAPPSTAMAFIKTIDPNNNFDMTNLRSEDMTSISTDWTSYLLFIYIDEGLVGQFCQFGFSSTATSYNPSSIIYDNVIWSHSVSSVPGSLALGGELKQNYPNPFNPKTRIEFSLEKSGNVDISVYDVSGRLVTHLLSEDMAAGDHYVVWNGQTRSGSPAPAGQYHYVMRTETGQMSRSMVLLK
jgi:hypothetical protein